MPSADGMVSSIGALWIVESGPPRCGRRHRRERAGGPSCATRARGQVRISLSFYRANLIPAFQGNLFIAGSGDRTILRLQFDPKRPMQVVSTERLLLDEFDRLRAIGMGRDGAIYFCTSNALMKMAPD